MPAEKEKCKTSKTSNLKLEFVSSFSFLWVFEIFLFFFKISRLSLTKRFFLQMQENSQKMVKIEIE